MFVNPDFKSLSGALLLFTEFCNDIAQKVFVCLKKMEEINRIHK